MWAPADLFKPGLNAVLFGLKGVFTYFYEHPLVLTITTLAVAALIALAALLGRRRGSD